MARRELRTQTLELIERIVDTVADRGSDLVHSSFEALPQRRQIISVLRRCEEVLFPGYFGAQDLYRGNLRYHLGDQLYVLARQLRREVTRALLLPYNRGSLSNEAAEARAGEVVFRFLEGLPEIMDLVADDVTAAFDGDPAATGANEIVMSYPGVKAVYTYRIAHLLHQLDVPLIPRIMTEFAHHETGVDIHPGATVGRHFFIDHATGVVIGETTEIGDRVKLYQGVTLGALSFPKDERGRLIRGHRRHPTIEDDVVIYAGATILGNTTIGRGSVIGGNVWLTTSVPPFTRVILSREQLAYDVTTSRQDDRGSPG